MELMMNTIPICLMIMICINRCSPISLIKMIKMMIQSTRMFRVLEEMMITCMEQI